MLVLKFNVIQNLFRIFENIKCIVNIAPGMELEIDNEVYS